MNGRWTQARVARVGICASIMLAATFVGLGDSPAGAQPSPCGVAPPCENWMSVSSAGSAPVGDTVDVYVSVDWATTPYQGFNAVIEYDGSVALFSNLFWVWGDPCLIPEQCLNDIPVGGGLRQTTVQGGLVSGTTLGTGVVVQLRYECVGAGSTTLRLVPPAGGWWTGATTIAPGDSVIPTGLAAGQITCSAPAETATPTSTPTAVSTPSPTATPAGAVGGVAEFSALAGGSANESQVSDHSTRNNVALAAGAALGVLTITAVAWFSRRRWLR
jgi:hypothetical protein